MNTQSESNGAYRVFSHFLPMSRGRMICKSLPMSAFSHDSVNLRKVSLVLQLHSPVHTIQDAISTIYFSKLDFTEQLHRQRIHNINRLPPGITHDQEKFLRCNMHGWLNAHLSKYQPASLASTTTTTTTTNHFKLRVFVDDPEWLNKSHEIRRNLNLFAR